MKSLAAFLLVAPFAALSTAQLSSSFEGKQTASDAAAQDQFGHGVAISGDLAVVGAQNGDGAAVDSGSAYAFLRTGMTWAEEQELVASDGLPGDSFGVHVAISGNTIVVGARFNDEIAVDAGAAYVFTRSGTTWTQEAKLTASDGMAGDALGRRVAIDGDTIVVGANFNDEVDANAGAAYVFTRSGTTWSEEAKLTASDGLNGDRFGVDVFVDGDTAIIGALNGDGNAVDSGSAYVFTRSGTTWTEEQELFAADGAGGDSFGRTVSVRGDTAVIGAQSDDDDGTSSGSAYVFERTASVWSEEAKLTASDALAQDQFGSSVSINTTEDIAAIGALQGDGFATNSGSVYVFSRNGPVWTQEGELRANDGANADQYGFAVSIESDTIITGAIGNDDDGSSSGSTYIYRVTVLPPAVDAMFTNLTLPKGLGNYDASGGDVHSPGAVFTDLTDDGYPDLYLIRDSFANELYVNVDDGLGGRTFVQVANNGGAGDDLSKGQGAIAGDYDNDGDPDLYVINWQGENVLYRNMWVENTINNLTLDPLQLFFIDVTATTDPTPGVADDQHGLGFATFDNTALGLGNDVLHNSLSAAWADVNRDGLLDLYHGSHDGLTGNPSSAEDGQLGERDTMYLNMGDGTFYDVTMDAPWSPASWNPITGWEDAGGSCCDTNLANPQTPREFSCTNAVTFADFDNDGWPDLMVTNKSGTTIDRDMLYLNLGLDGNGDWAGFECVTYTMPAGNGGTIGFGTFTAADMGVIAGDLDNDGDLEAYSSLGSVFPTFCDDGSIDGDNVLWINQLSDTGTLSFNQNKDLLEAVWSWGVNFVDFDNNGRLDAHAVTELDARSFLYLQDRDGSWTEYSKQSGIDQCDDLPRSFGNPTADYNRDGWMDLMVINTESNVAGPMVMSAFFQNDSALANPDHHFLGLKLVGNPNLRGPLRSTRDAIGARVYVSADLDGSGVIDANETMLREVTSGSGNAATTCSLELHFGLGKATTANVKVQWPSGRVSRAVLAADQLLTLNEGEFVPGGLYINGGPQLTPK